MTISSRLQAGFNRVIDLAGVPIKVNYYNVVYDNVYDEQDLDNGLLLSGTVWTSGVVFPLDSRRGSSDANLLEQGRLIDSDKKLFVNGSLALAGSEVQVKIQVGSPTGVCYAAVPIGAIVQESDSNPVFKKQFIRRLTNGSLVGE